VVASRSVCAGDNFTVVQMGTLGEVGSVHQQLGVLVLVRSPLEQSKARHEVFTAEQFRPTLQMVEWRRCGLPAMEEAKFFQQADDLRNADGVVFAHYDSVQYGAQRLYCTDGSSVLSTHSLFRVQELAVDTVRPVGVHPTIFKGKYVDMPLEQYDLMFKIVSGQPGEHEHRIARANSTYEQTKHLVYNTHPAYMIVRDLHIDTTSPRMNQKTSSVFDVRGQPISQGDFIRGCAWPDEEPQTLFNVPLSELQQFTGMLRTHAADLPSPVTPVSHETYVGLVAKGFMQFSTTLDKQCMRVMGFLRIQPAKEGDEPLAMKDPLFAVVHVLTSAVNPVIEKLDPASRMLLVPRHHSGQWFFVKSGLTGPAAIDVMFRYAAVSTNQILVNGLVVETARITMALRMCPEVYQEPLCAMMQAQSDCTKVFGVTLVKPLSIQLVPWNKHEVVLCSQQERYNIIDVFCNRLHQALGAEWNHYKTLGSTNPTMIVLRPVVLKHIEFPA